MITVRTLAIPMAALAACVLSPVDGDSVTSRVDPLTFEGYASAPNARIQLRAWDQVRGMWMPLATTQASATVSLDGATPLYAWSASALTGTRVWRPPSGTCTSTGTARFQVRERSGTSWYALGTFDSDALGCLNDRLGAGLEPYPAGAACVSGSEVMLHAPAQCALPPPPPGHPTSPPGVQLTMVHGDEVQSARDYAWPWLLFPVPSTGWVRLDAETFAARGASTIRIDARIEIECGANTLVPPIVVNRSRLNATSNGAPADVSIGTWLDIDHDQLQTYCPAGKPMTRNTIRITVTGTDAQGRTRVVGPFPISRPISDAEYPT